MVEIIKANTCRTCAYKIENENGDPCCAESPPTHFMFVAGMQKSPDGTPNPIIGQHVAFRPIILDWSCGKHKPKIERVG